MVHHTLYNHTVKKRFVPLILWVLRAETPGVEILPPSAVVVSDSHNIRTEI
jgi:hypothetical protein